MHLRRTGLRVGSTHAQRALTLNWPGRERLVLAQKGQDRHPRAKYMSEVERTVTDERHTTRAIPKFSHHKAKFLP
jgi:hypothetical protein